MMNPHKALAEELRLENHDLLNRLMEARSHIAVMRGIIQSAQKQGCIIGDANCHAMADMDRFMAAGLFGEKQS